jgi:BirA family transcriptional regulator, biotin operon repressor / biotin---[acetyl-CoA-carboxylase] ligase
MLAWHLRGAFGRVHEHHVEIASTNDRAAAWAKAGAPHGALVTADAQTQGRGRRGRAWHSPAAENLCASLVVRPGPVGPALGAIGLAVAVGLREGLPRLEEGVALKWPNDLVVAGRKLGGILCESRWCGAVPEIVVGFGINVHTKRFPDPLAAVATSLATVMPGGAPERAPLLAALLVSLEDTLSTFFEGGFSAIRARYESHCTTLGRTVEIDEGSTGRRRMVAEALDHDGALLVRPLEGGPSRRVEAADVWIAP